MYEIHCFIFLQTYHTIKKYNKTPLLKMLSLLLMLLSSCSTSVKAGLAEEVIKSYLEDASTEVADMFLDHILRNTGSGKDALWEECLKSTHYVKKRLREKYGEKDPSKELIAEHKKLLCEELEEEAKYSDSDKSPVDRIFDTIFPFAGKVMTRTTQKMRYQYQAERLRKWEKESRK